MRKQFRIILNLRTGGVSAKKYSYVPKGLFKLRDCIKIGVTIHDKPPLSIMDCGFFVCKKAPCRALFFQSIITNFL